MLLSRTFINASKQIEKCSLSNVFNFMQQSSNFSEFANSVRCVGKLNDPKISGIYETGQPFLHRVFGYRGAILFPWMARVFDRDALYKKDKIDEAVETLIEDPLNCNPVGKDIKGKVNTFYQVLIDDRDSPYIRAQPESVSYLGNQANGRPLLTFRGLDYVAHEDIMPFTAIDKIPIQNDLFQKFLVCSKEDEDPPFCARSELKSWQEQNTCWLELSDVHKETTENIRITVTPFYLGSRLSQNTNEYVWRYCIRLENLGIGPVQLRERHWRIFSLSGTLETIRGRGVIGQEPILSSQHPAFQYSSHVCLQAPSGHMWGTFRMEREDGYTFDCKIPPFSLESKHDDNSPADFA